MNGDLRAHTLRVASAVLISALVLFPFLLDEIAGIRLWAIAIGYAALSVELVLSGRSARARLLIVAGTAVLTVTLLAAIELSADALGSRPFAVNAEHLFILFPLFAATGMEIMRSGKGRTYLTVGVTIAALAALLALIEFASDSSVLGRDLVFLTSQREGPTRALVGSEHVLVLGASLAAFVPLTSAIRRRPVRLSVGIVILLGTWASGSRIPAAVATLMFIVQSVPAVKHFVMRNTRYLVLLASVGLAALTVCAVFIWSPFIGGETGLDFSANYRFASYAVLPLVLLAHPLGYLLVGAPPGAWVVASESRGIVDLGMSADSELLYAAFTLGWPGLIAFLVLLFISLKTVQVNFAIGAASSSLMVMGFSLALHGWDGMSNLWYLLIGSCMYLLHQQIVARRVNPPRRRVKDAAPGEGPASHIPDLPGGPDLLETAPSSVSPNRWWKGLK